MVTEIEDLGLIARTITECREQMRAHLELGSGDAASVIVRLNAELNSPGFSEAFERAEMRALSKELKASNE